MKLSNAFRRTRKCTGLLVVVLVPLYFNPNSEFPFERTKVTLFQGLVALMTIALALEETVTRLERLKNRTSPRRRIWANPLTVPLLLYGAAFLFATLLSINRNQSWWGWTDKHGTFTMLCVVGFFFLSLDFVDTPGDRFQWVTAVLIGSVPVSIYGLTQSMGFDPLTWTTDSVSPVLSTMGRSNFLGAYLAMVTPYTLSRLVDGRGLCVDQARPIHPFRLLSNRNLCLLLLQMLVLFLCQARGAWLALAGGTAVFLGLLITRPQSRVVLRVYLVVLAFCGLAFSTVFLLNYVPRHGTSQSKISYGLLRTSTVESRIRIWRAALALVPDRWLYGYGPDTFVNVFNETYPPAEYWGRPNLIIDDPHNVLLEHLLSVGTIGFVFLVATFGAFYLSSFRRIKKTRDGRRAFVLSATAASVTAFLIQSQFNPDVIVLWILLYTSFALGAGPSVSTDLVDVYEL